MTANTDSRDAEQELAHSPAAGDIVPSPAPISLIDHELLEGDPVYGLLGTIEAVTGKGDDLAAHLADAAAALAGEPSCHLYLVSRLPDQPDVVHVTEVWDDADAHEASLQLPAVQQLIATARPVIAGMGERTELTPIAAKGMTIA